MDSLTTQLELIDKDFYDMYVKECTRKEGYSGQRYGEFQ